VFSGGIFMKEIKQYLSEIGKKGGSVKSPAKKRSGKRNMANARKFRWKGREDGK